MRKFLVFIFSLVSLSALAQQSDTLYSYTNIGGKEVKKLDKAVNIYKIYKGDKANWVRTTSDRDLILIKKETFADEKLLTLNGPYIEYQNGKVNLSGTYLKDSKVGEWIRYYPEGTVMESETYSENILNGPFYSFHTNGKKMEEGSYINGKMDGEWKLYGEEGELKSIKVFKDGALITPVNSGVKLLNITPPQFPGGIKMFYTYLARNTNYPKEALQSKITGKVYFTITIDKEGRAKDFNVISSPGNSLTEEAKRVALSSPKWIPGTEDGKPVDMKQSLNINFSVN